jgi:hypothetical protein
MPNKPARVFPILNSLCNLTQMDSRLPRLGHCLPANMMETPTLQSEPTQYPTSFRANNPFMPLDFEFPGETDHGVPWSLQPFPFAASDDIVCLQVINSPPWIRNNSFPQFDPPRALPYISSHDSQTAQGIPGGGFSGDPIHTATLPIGTCEVDVLLLHQSVALASDAQSQASNASNLAPPFQLADFQHQSEIHPESPLDFVVPSDLQLRNQSTPPRSFDLQPDPTIVSGLDFGSEGDAFVVGVSSFSHIVPAYTVLDLREETPFSIPTYPLVQDTLLPSARSADIRSSAIWNDTISSKVYSHRTSAIFQDVQNNIEATFSLSILARSTDQQPRIKSLDNAEVESISSFSVRSVTSISYSDFE